MKRLILLIIAMPLFYCGIAQAKGSTYISPDKKKKAVYSCNYAYEKAFCPTNNTMMFRTRCSISIHYIGSGKKEFLVDGYFFDDEKSWAKKNTLEYGKPLWSHDSRYFAFIKLATPYNDAAFRIYDTKTKKNMFMYSPKTDEVFCALNKKGDITNQLPRVYATKNSFYVGVYDGATLTAKETLYIYKGKVLEYKLDGTPLPTKEITVFEDSSDGPD